MAAANKNTITFLWYLDVLLWLICAFCFVCVDGNGGIFGIPEPYSLILILSLAGCGVLINLYLMKIDRNRRISAFILLALYFVFIIMAIAPLL
jgi:hypothetical protein